VQQKQVLIGEKMSTMLQFWQAKAKGVEIFHNASSGM